MRHAVSRGAVLATLFLSLPALAGAQRPQPGGTPPHLPPGSVDARIERLHGLMSAWDGAPNRAVLGVILAEPSRGDTAGVRIVEVQPDSPAARSGLKAGDVITAINGVSLRISPADADDRALSGLAQRRLARTLARAKAGDTVDLAIGAGSSQRTVQVGTVSAASMATDGPRALTGLGRPRMDQGADQGAIGLTVGGAGNARDTLGLFVGAVVSGGPAERAGIIEGERIASVNGVDVRLPREDIDDASAMSARASRFARVVQGVAPGGAVALRVHSGGRYRDVTVQAVRRSDLPNGAATISIGDGAFTFTMPELGRLRELSNEIPRVIRLRQPARFL